MFFVNKIKITTFCKILIFLNKRLENKLTHFYGRTKIIPGLLKHFYKTLPPHNIQHYGGCIC